MPEAKKKTAEEYYSCIVDEFSKLNDTWKQHVYNVVDKIGSITSMEQAYFIVHYALLFQALADIA